MSWLQVRETRGRLRGTREEKRETKKRPKRSDDELKSVGGSQRRSLLQNLACHTLTAARLRSLLKPPVLIAPSLSLSLSLRHSGIRSSGSGDAKGVDARRQPSVSECALIFSHPESRASHPVSDPFVSIGFTSDQRQGRREAGGEAETRGRKGREEQSLGSRSSA